MDPLVDHYNSVVDKAELQMQQLYSEAIEKTKAFIVQISLSLLLLLACTLIHH